MQDLRLQTQDNMRSMGRGPSLDVSRNGGGAAKLGVKALDENPRGWRSALSPPWLAQQQRCEGLLFVGTEHRRP